MKKTIRSIGMVILATVALALTSCDESDDPPPPNVDVSGAWSGDWSSVTHSGLSGSFSLSVVQTDSVLTGTISVPYIGLYNAELTGTITGDDMTFGDISNTITFVGVVDGSGALAFGSYNYLGLADSGTWNASKSSSPATVTTLDVSGPWTGSWSSLTTSVISGGSFSLSVAQADSVLTGTITVPEISLYDAELTGTMVGTNMTFGDIDDNITFIGVVDESGALAVGTYSSTTWDNSGTWSATKTDSPPIATYVDVSGPWSGGWSSSIYSGISGSFSLSVTQSDSVLTGTINVPDIGLFNADLTGNIMGNNMTFGDIDDNITFIGVVDESGALAFGIYNYETWSDNGTWSATKSAP